LRNKETWANENCCPKQAQTAESLALLAAVVGKKTLAQKYCSIAESMEPQAAIIGKTQQEICTIALTHTP